MTHSPRRPEELPGAGPPPLPAPGAATALIASVSGGVDSDYAALWLRRRYPDQPIILWHAYLPEDWPETRFFVTLGERMADVVHLFYEHAIF